MSLVAFGLQSPNTLLAFITLVGVLISGGIGVMFLAEGVSFIGQNPARSQTKIWESRKYLVTAMSFLVFGALTVLFLVALLVALGISQSSKRSQKNLRA